MAEFTPTKGQKAAIETRGGAVLVSAAAGSGKTRVLTQRLMGYLTDEENPRDIDSFLVITFTKAAAAELRGRVLDGIGRALTENPENKRLRRQSALCQQAQIGTIHSFCQTVLRENCHLLGISPDFRVADEERARAMKESALLKVLEGRYDSPERFPDFALLADTVGAGRDDSRLGALVLQLHARMQSHPRPDKWAAEQKAALELDGISDAGETAWGRELLDGAMESAEYWAGEMDRLIEKIRGEEKIKAAYAPSLEETALGLRDFYRAAQAGWDRAREFSDIPFPRLGSVRNSPNPELAELVKSRREASKKACRAIGEKFLQSSDKLLSDMRKTAPAMGELLDLTLDFDREFSARKRRAALLDFDDLEHLTAQLLIDDEGAPTQTARELSRRYTEIMIDEYQDVSRVQDAIFKAVSRNGENLFMVGDVKQAIYRFRLADPAIFTEKYESFVDEEKAGEGEARRIFLRENFRSRREIIDGANRVFGACMSKELGEIDYDENAALRLGASYEGAVPAPELLLIRLENADEDAPDKVKIEAGTVAAQIRRLLDSGETVWDNGVKRALRSSDIAILLRSANAVGGEYRRALISEGVPVCGGQGGGFFSSIEVSCVMSMLAVIDNPHQDIPLIALLRSPAFGFTPDELSEIRGEDSNADFYGALKKAGERMEKACDFLSVLGDFRALSADLSLGELLWKIYNELDLPALCSAMTDGENRRRNLMAFLEYAGKFEETGYRGLHRFVEWLGRLSDRGQEPESAAAGGEGVRVLSIHKSKGLEFPVVFLCDTGRRFNKQDTRQTVLVHPELGLGPKVTDLENKVEYPSLARRAIAARADREMLSEELRLLYVALTRARERLFITAAIKEPEAVMDKLRDGATYPVAAELLRGAQYPAQWLMYAAMGDDTGALRLCIMDPESGDGSEATEEDPAENGGDDELIKRLSEKLDFAYPFEAAQNVPSKVTATEMKSSWDEADGEDAFMLPKLDGIFRAPNFAPERGKISAAERGTLTHLVMERLDFHAESGQAELRRLVDGGVLSREEADCVDSGGIESFLRSEIGREMRNASVLNREFRFSVLLPAEEFFPEAGGEEVLLQGAIDCWYETSEGLVIVDYKTDRVSAGETALRARFYEGQIRAYRLALEKITGKRVCKTALYFLNPGKMEIFL